ncbi:MAG: YitT family protein, partial [Clostridia bacterium]|nr:YitT family protein [Clostridia bacterium]
MNSKNKQAIINEVKGYLFMVLGCVAYGLSTSLFLAPNQIIAGGVTGLAVLINFLYPNVLIGMISIVINVPILFFG